MQLFGFVLLVEVAIANPIPPVISSTTKKILSRFPSWMKLFEDSIEDATPDVQMPQTVAGKFLNALVSDSAENFEKQVNIYQLDRGISTADINQADWIYTCFDVPASISRVVGDGVVLSRVDSIVDLYDSLIDDYCYYYSGLDRNIITKKLFKTLIADSITYDQVPTLKWNWFDEYGARVGIKRLYLETNANFKNRILDVYKNPPGTTTEAIKKTLRRELDLWTAFGTTPDSNYVGATPEILEIEDIENSTPYFDFDGNPTDEFKRFVKELNEKYPVNLGYVKWGQGFWDYAGEKQTGVGRITASYEESTPLGDYYQPGVADADDAKIIIREPFENEIEINSRFKAIGSRFNGIEDYYSPIKVGYQYYGSYYQDYYDNESATLNLRYMLDLPVHGSYATPTVFYSDVIVYPKNKYSPTNQASPEFNVVNIFDQDGYAYKEYVFRDLLTNSLYLDTSATPDNNRVNYYYSTKAHATPQSGSSNFRLEFYGSTPFTETVNQSINLSTPNFNNGGANLKVLSKIYNVKRARFITDPKLSSEFLMNSINDTTSIDDYVLDQQVIHNSLVFPPGATPEYVYIENVEPTGYEISDSIYLSPEYSGYGGLSQSNLIDYLIPSSPNIIAQYVNANFATPDQHFGYIDTDSGTVNYYFVELKYPYDSTPDSIVFTTGLSSTPVYPFKIDQWEYFEEFSTPMIEGTINKNGVIRSDPNNWDETFTKNSNIVGRYSLTYDTFNLDKDNDYIEKIEVVNDTDGVELYVSDQYVTVDYEESPLDWLSNTITEFDGGILSGVQVSAKYNGIYSSYINTGWYSQHEEDYYIYSTPISETFATPGFDLLLSDVIRQGAPIIINRLHASPTELMQVAFYDEASPTSISITNNEVIKANKSNNLYFGFEDIYNVNVYDSVTGYQVLSEAQSTSNYVEVFSQATPVVFGREYLTDYKVKNSYTVDNDYYDSNDHKYKTKIEFDSTPESFYSYEIIYEGSAFGHSTPISLEIDPMKIWDDEGFVYLSHSDYNFSSFEIKLSPNYISDNSSEIMFLNVISLDQNGNVKPYQTFSISGSLTTTNQAYYTTDINGFASARIYYSGPIPAVDSIGTIQISGIQNGSPNAHINSQTEGYQKQITFDITTIYNNSVDLRAISDNLVITADGVSENYIYGYVSEGATPAPDKVVYWRKGRTVYDTFESTPYYDYVTTDTSGKFTIGPFTTNNGIEPGIWFVSVETENAATVNYSPTTIAGDIVYWYEKYDNLNYYYENSLLYTSDVLYGQSEDLYSTPIFTVNYNDGEYSTPYSSTPNWLPPKWYPLNRHTQYLMGLLGSTPYYVNSYSQLMNEYEED